jgi:hypothetical protein
VLKAGWGLVGGRVGEYKYLDVRHGSGSVLQPVLELGFHSDAVPCSWPPLLLLLSESIEITVCRGLEWIDSYGMFYIYSDRIVKTRRVRWGGGGVLWLGHQK